MRNEKTYDTKSRRNRWIAAIAAFCLCLAVGLGIYTLTSGSLSSQGEETLRQTILNSAKQCAAIEGSYPSSLKYLEEKYGLSVNHKDYLVTYEVFASNVVPDVVVSAR